MKLNRRQREQWQKLTGDERVERLERVKLAYVDLEGLNVDGRPRRCAPPLHFQALPPKEEISKEERLKRAKEHILALRRERRS